MKILICTGMFMLYFVVLSAQHTAKKVTLRLKDVPLEVVFQKIQEQTGIPISYSASQIPLNKTVSIAVKNKPLEETLQEICKPLGLTFTFVENQYIIKPVKEQSVQIDNRTEELQRYTISGYVYDKHTGEAIPGAVVYTADLKYGTVTNGYGFYSLTIPGGQYVFLSSYLGYQTDTLRLLFTKNSTHHFYLLLDEIFLKPIEVRHVQDSTYVIIKNFLGYDELHPSAGSCAPVVFSEPDILKTITYFPGVKNTVDGSTFYFVRGGERDQNLIYLDDAPIYNPSHLFGIFSTINPETLSDIQFYKSDYPFSRGGRLSSILELRTREGNRSRFSLSGDWNFITNRLTMEFPLLKKRASMFLSLHGSHIENTAKRIMPDIYKFRFGDMQHKLNIQFNQKNRLYFAFYSSSDKFLLRNGSDIQGIQWGNFLTSLRWNRIWSDRMFSNSTVYVSSYSYELNQSFATGTKWNSAIATAAWNTDWYYYASPEVTHYFGMHLLGHRINPGMVFSSIPEIEQRFERIRQLNTGEAIVYYGSDRQLHGLWKLKYGLRFVSFSNVGPARYYVFDEHYKLVDSVEILENKPYNYYRVIEPSLTITRIIDEFQSLKFNYVHRHQFLQVLSNSISPFTTLEIWYPSTVNIKPQSLHQWTTGWYVFLTKLRSTLSVEVFYRFFGNQIDYQNQAQLILNPLLEQQICQYMGYAYGFDIILKKELGKLQGWIGYSFVRARRMYKDEKGVQKTYRGSGDRPVDISGFIHWQPRPRSAYTAGLICASGLPVTVPTGYFYYQGYSVPIFDEKNNWRMPVYFRIDISSRWMLNKPERRWKHYLTLSIYNFTARKNPSFISFNKIVDHDGRYVTPMNLAFPLHLQPTMTYLFGFIPSLKYSFQF